MADEVFAAYAGYLAGIVWPSVERGYQDEKHTLVPEMAPQHASAALHKLCRWAKFEPAGDTALYPDEHAREGFVRTTRLGLALTARAVGLSEEEFHGLYGEYGAGRDVDGDLLLAEVTVTLGDHGLEDWSLRDRLLLARKIVVDLVTRYRVVDRI